jgi:hypothetical protein
LFGASEMRRAPWWGATLIPAAPASSPTRIAMATYLMLVIALATYQKAEIEKWGPIIKAAGIKLE